MILFFYSFVFLLNKVSSQIDYGAYRVATIIKPPFIQKVFDPNSGKYIFTGYCVDLLEMIKANMPYSMNYEIYEVKHKMYGIQVNGAWNALVAALIHKEADIALGPFRVSKERENFIDFTTAFYEPVGIGILAKANTIYGTKITATSLTNFNAGSNYICIKGSSTENEIEKCLPNLYAALRHNGMANNMSEAINRILTSVNNTALIGDASDLRYAALNDCRLQVVGGNDLWPKPYALGIQKGSTLKIRLSNAISRLRKEGKLIALKEKWWTKTKTTGCR